MAKKKLPTIEALPDDWVEQLVPLYQAGAGDDEAIAHLKITVDAFDSLYDSDQYFKDVIDYGNTARKAWWLRWGRTNLNERSAQYAGWKFMMNNLFGWSDKPSEGITEGELSSLTEDQLNKALQDAAEKLFNTATDKAS